jgi:hypothetical protein
MPPATLVDPATIKYNFVAYVLHFFGDDVVRYVGITQFEKDREKQHYEAMSGAPRVVQARIAYGECRSKVVAGLYGTLREAQALETYLMKKFGTILGETKEHIEMKHSDKNPKRLPWPDVSLYPNVPASKQLNCKASVNQAKYADKIAAAGEAYEAGQTPPPDLTEAEKKKLHALVESYWEGEEWLTVGDEADDDTSIVFAVDSPFARARELKEEYEALPPHAQVDRDVVAGQLASVGQYFQYDDEDKSKAELEGMIKLWQKSVHPNNERLHGKPLTAGYAAALFGLVFEWCGEREEQLLLLRHGVDPADEEAPLPHLGSESTATTIKLRDILQALQWRRFSEAHDGAAPKKTGQTAAVQPKEAKLTQAMEHWRSGHGGKVVARRNQSLYLLLLRHHAWFASYVRGEKATGSSGLNVARDVNHYLRLGYGSKAEVDAGVADRTIPAKCNVCGANNAVSYALVNFLAGANAKRADVLLAPGGKLTESRAATLRALHESNIEERTARAAASNAKKKAAKEANGRGKKRKAEEPVDESGSDDASDDDE